MQDASRRSRRLYCDWSGRRGKKPGSLKPIRPRNWRSELMHIAACATASAISSPSVTFPGGPLRGIRSESANTWLR
jgi:hypothetical protein